MTLYNGLNGTRQEYAEFEDKFKTWWNQFVLKQSHQPPSIEITSKARKLNSDEEVIQGSSEYPCECAVCLMSLNDNGEMETKALPCKHEFHDACVDRWLLHFSSTCPLCRFSIQQDDQYSTFTLEMLMIWFSSFHVAGF